MQNSRVQYLFMSARETPASESKDSDNPHGLCARVERFDYVVWKFYIKCA